MRRDVASILDPVEQLDPVAVGERHLRCQAIPWLSAGAHPHTTRADFIVA
jgi:hypothetical protein